jgi:hypothetical protein
MKSRRFIACYAPDTLGPSVSDFLAHVQAVACPSGSFSTETSNSAYELMSASNPKVTEIAATWLMQRGAPMWEAAGFLGMSEKALRETYGPRHPDHLRGAANAIGTRPAPNKNVVLVDVLVEKSRNVRVVRKLLEALVGLRGLEPLTRPL